MKKIKLFQLSSVLLSALLLAGGGCMTSSSTNTNTANSNITSTTVSVDETDEDTDEDTNTDEDTDSSLGITIQPEIEIVSPEDGETVESDFDLVVNIEHFDLDEEALEGENVEGVGHYHVLVDGEYHDLGTEETFQMEGLSKGEHQIEVSLANNDHTDLDAPLKTDPITVVVE